MSIEDNKEMVRRVIEEAANKGNLDILDDIMTPNYVYHYPGMDVKGPDGFKQFVTVLRTALPDLHIAIEDMVAEGDTVAARFAVRGTFKGELMGMAPTGRQIDVAEAVFIRFEGGKEVEATPYADMLSFYQQLGVSPPA